MKRQPRKLDFNVPSSLEHNRADRAFTLIELLVVIAIIALLLSIIIPAVNLAKRKAASAVCLVNTKHLALAWYSYQDENKGRLVSSNTGNGGWVENPEYADGTDCGDTSSMVVTDEDEIRGIRKGTLYPYYEEPRVLHCPADNQRKSKFDGTNIFRTYSIAACLSSPVKKFSEIVQPSMRYNFVEEADARNFNVGSWSFQTAHLSDSNMWVWQDVVAINHGDSSIIGFCDGHAEVHKWVDSYTKLRVKTFLENPSILNTGQIISVIGDRPFEEITDIEFMVRGWAYRQR